MPKEGNMTNDYSSVSNQSSSSNNNDDNGHVKNNHHVDVIESNNSEIHRLEKLLMQALLTTNKLNASIDVDQISNKSDDDFYNEEDEQNSNDEHELDKNIEIDEEEEDVESDNYNYNDNDNNNADESSSAPNSISHIPATSSTTTTTTTTNTNKYEITSEINRLEKLLLQTMDSIQKHQEIINPSTTLQNTPQSQQQGQKQNLQWPSHKTTKQYSTKIIGLEKDIGTILDYCIVTHIITIRLNDGVNLKEIIPHDNHNDNDNVDNCCWNEVILRINHEYEFIVPTSELLQGVGVGLEVAVVVVVGQEKDYDERKNRIATVKYRHNNNNNNNNDGKQVCMIGHVVSIVV